MALRISALLGALAISGVPAMGAEHCRVPLERPYSLGHPFAHPLEAAHGRAVRGEAPLGFAFPVFASAECDDASRPRLAWSDSSGARAVGLLGLLGGEYRSRYGGVSAAEAGGLFSGRSGPVSFRLDARTTTEVGGDAGRPSFDREDVDDQDEETTGALDYRSYSRFRGDLTADLGFGRLTVARDAAHWGPGLFLNPVFNQEAVPFFQYVFSTELGPLKVSSLYGDLAIGESQAFDSKNLDGRHLFAHRYELTLGRSWLVGVTEQLVLFDLTRPYLFAPVFPLFVAKSYLVEDRTNGNLAADIAWRSPWATLLYAEFLLDDLESPSSLLTESYIQNKWAVLLGAHWSRPLSWGVAGVVAEFGHAEPWVYAHFDPSTAQAAHAGFSLGNPHGADSRTLLLKAYARLPGRLYGGLRAGLRWKGRGASADLNAPVPKTPTAEKTRLEGEGSPDGTLEPEVAWTGRHMHTYLLGRLGAGPEVRTGIRLFY